MQLQTSNGTHVKNKQSKANLGKRKGQKAANSCTGENSRRVSLDQSNRAQEITDADQQLSVVYADQNLIPVVI